MHHNSPVYLIAEQRRKLFKSKDEEYEKKFNDKNKEPDMNQIVEIYPGKYKKFMRGNAIFCMENLIKYINEKFHLIQYYWLEEILIHSQVIPRKF